MYFSKNFANWAGFFVLIGGVWQGENWWKMELLEMGFLSVYFCWLGIDRVLGGCGFVGLFWWLVRSERNGWLIRNF